MSWWIILIIAAPFLFVIGTVMNALKEQKRFEDGPLQDMLKKRHQERQEYLKRTGSLPPDPYEDKK